MEYIFDKYKILETLSAGEYSELYLVEEIETGEKFALRKVFLNTFEPFYKKAIKALKKVCKKEPDGEEHGNSPVILNVFTEIEYIYLLFEYKDENSLRRILSFPSIGRILNRRYVALKGIASGGFGIVYLVRDLSLPGKYWALKEMQDEGDFISIEKNFRSEAEILSTLEHPSIPRMSDFFSAKEKLYLVMDYVEGETLKKKLKKMGEGSHFSEDYVIDWAIGLCDVLQYLHTRPKPIVFRALKPDNIMITPEGKVKLIDFAIARVFDGPKSKKTTNSLHKEGYAPPEQWVGKAEPRSDIYSLGATLYHLMTGLHPGKLVGHFPPIEDHNPSISPLFKKIINRALQEKRKDRFQSAEEMKLEIMGLYEYREGHNHLARAKEYENKNDFFNANFEYMKALELFRGGNYEVLTSIARCHEKLHFNDKALEYYNRALELDLPEKFKEEILNKMKSLSITKELDSQVIREAHGEKAHEMNFTPDSEIKEGKTDYLRGTKKLKLKTFLPALTVIFFIGLILAFLIDYRVKLWISGKEEEKITLSLRTARSICEGELKDIEKVIKLVAKTGDPLKSLKEEFPGADYVYMVKKEDTELLKSEIALKSFEGEEQCGVRIIDRYELEYMGEDLCENLEIKLLSSENARPVAEKILKRAMVLECAVPVSDENDNVTYVLYCGKFINKNDLLADRIYESIFENKIFKGKPAGAVVIYLDDVAIGSNPLDEKGNRPLGTRVSQDIYEKVVIEGNSWYGRAFLLNDRYLTSCEPIKDIKGNTIGILSTGYLEDALREENNIIIYSFRAIIFFATIFSMIIYIYTRSHHSN